MTIYWTHSTTTGDANGVGWTGGGSGGNGDAIGGGGYVAVYAGGAVPSETDGSSAQGLFPLVATRLVWNTNYGGQWDFVLGFAVPAGLAVATHTWVVVP